jgi:DMSO/TMAO reductase YedYZ heme-binding membrane subunit
MLKKIFLHGQIPYLAKIKPVLYWFAWILPLTIFLMPREHGEFAEIGWKALLAVMAIRPLADLLPDLRVLRTLTALRREVGVFAGMMILAHVVGWMILRDVSLVDIFTSGRYWQFDGIFLWGLLGMFAGILVLITSNSFAMKLLQRNWKRVQSLSYLFLLFGGIHIWLVGEEEAILGMAFVFVLWVLAKFKLRVRLLKNS